MLFLLGTLLVPSARAQSVSAVPAGVRAVTVMVCDQPDGCAEAFQALSDHCAGQGIPLLDFDEVAAAGPGGGDARAALDAALAAADAHPDLAHLQVAREALRDTPLTILPDELFRLWLRLGDARLKAGDTAGVDAGGAAHAFAAAASTSGDQVYNLPPLSAAGLDAYLQAAEQRPAPAVLEISADHEAATVFVDGRPAGVAPVQVEVQPGWHRLSVERPGRRTAWVGEVDASPDRHLVIRAELDRDDAPVSLEAAVIGAIHGAQAPPDVARNLAAWARLQGLARVRFVELSPPKASGRVPEERVHTRDGMWDLHSVWLDVSADRLETQGPGLLTLRQDADPERFTMGVQLGYHRLQQTLPTGADPHDHLDLELVGLVKVAPTVAIDVRLGLWHAAQPYYLYRDWLAHEVVPVSAGLRWAPGHNRLQGGGFYLGAHALAVVPLALGGEAFAGWTWKPTPRWRLGLEAEGGYTDQGPVGGGAVGVGFAG